MTFVNKLKYPYKWYIPKVNLASLLFIYLFCEFAYFG